MKQKWWIGVLAFLLVLSVACSSAAKTSNTSSQYAATVSEYHTEEAWDDGYYDTVTVNTSASAARGESSTMASEVARKLIRDANLTVETKQFEQLVENLSDQIAAFGGYTESMSESGRSYRNGTSTRNAYFTARIPAERLDEFLNVVDGLGNVTQKGISTRDVTSTYVDIESRLKVLETEKDSLQKIMAGAENTVDMLETQSRLYDVIEEIEAYEAQKRTYDSLISFSTVSISVQEVLELTPAPEETRGEELVRRFTNSLADLGEAIVDFGIGFLVALPWLLVLGAACGLLFLIIFLPIHSKAKKRRKMAAEKAKTE